MQIEKSQSEGKRIMPERRLTELQHYPLTRGFAFRSLHRNSMTYSLSHVYFNNMQYGQFTLQDDNLRTSVGVSVTAHKGHL